MIPVFAASLISVLTVVLVCSVGSLLAHVHIMSPPFRKSLSRTVLTAMLPCLLVTKLSANTGLEELSRCSILPVAAILYVFMGFLVSRVVLVLVRVPENQRRTVVAATAFGNSGYIPYPLVVAVAAVAPIFADDPGAGDRGVAYISVYLVAFSPCLWGTAYPYLSGKSFRDLKWYQVLSPPVISALCGISLGVIRPLNALIVQPGAPLRVLYDAAELVGQAAIPCALLVLGANLVGIKGVGQDKIHFRTLQAVCLAKLIVMPLLGCAAVMGLRQAGMLPRDPMLTFVLMLEAAVPPATNLIVMCQVHNKGESVMSKVLFWNYITSTVTLTFFVTLFLHIITNLY